MQERILNMLDILLNSENFQQIPVANSILLIDMLKYFRKLSSIDILLLIYCILTLSFVLAITVFSAISFLDNSSLTVFISRERANFSVWERICVMLTSSIVFIVCCIISVIFETIACK